MRAASGHAARHTVRNLTPGGRRDAAPVAVAVAPAGVPGLGVRQRQAQAAGAARLLRLRPVAVAAPEVLSVVIVVAQPEEPHQPHDKCSDVEDPETDHEDPPLEGHLNARLGQLPGFPQAPARACRAQMPGPATLVLSGATSDLARSKLWPALLDLAASGRLPEPCDVLGKDAVADLPTRDGRRWRPLLSES